MFAIIAIITIICLYLAALMYGPLNFFDGGNILAATIESSIFMFLLVAIMAVIWFVCFKKKGRIWHVIFPYKVFHLSYSFDSLCNYLDLWFGRKFANFPCDCYYYHNNYRYCRSHCDRSHCWGNRLINKIPA